MVSKRILQGFLFLNISIIFYGYLAGFGKSLWFDELLSINHARELNNFSLEETFTQHPNALFYFLLSYVEKFLELLNLNPNKDINIIRLINLIGLIPILFSYKIIKDEKVQIDIGILFLLLISSNYFFNYILEIRPYFLILGFAFLISILNLTDPMEEKYKFLFISSSIIISIFHIYGLTLSISVLFYRLVINFYKKNLSRIKVDIYILFLLLITFFLIYSLSIINFEKIPKFTYLKFQLYFVGSFIKWNLNTIFFLTLLSVLIIFIYVRRCSNVSEFFNFFVNKLYFNILSQIMPVITLLFVILLVSLIVTPLIHYRYLIVIYPALVITGGLLTTELLRYYKSKLLIFIILTIITFVNINFYLKNIINSEQNIEWVIKNTFNKNCESSEVYFNDNGKDNILDSVNKITKIYSKTLRPIKPLSNIDFNNLRINKNCKILAFSFHTYNLEKNLNNLNHQDLKLKIEYAPNVVGKGKSKSGAIVLVEKN